MNLFVISDVHLLGSSDPFYPRLLNLLQEGPKEGDHFVFAGDIFDLYVGNKRIFSKRYHLFFQILENKRQQGVTFHYLEGNHDFLLQELFAKLGVFYHTKDFTCSYPIDSPPVNHQLASLEFFTANGVKTLPQERRFFIAHGDLVNAYDYSYLLLRAFFRSPFIRVFVKWSPDSWVDQIGKWSSHSSRMKRHFSYGKKMHPTFEKREKIKTLFRQFADQKIKQGYDYVILGHNHELDECFFDHSPERAGWYFNVGYPKKDQTYLFWNSKKDLLERKPLP